MKVLKQQKQGRRPTERRIENVSPNSQSPCFLADADRRHLDAFSLWVQTKAHYFHPERFRLNLNNCIQALRNVTFVLQEAGSLLPGFAEWYDCWQERMRADPLLKWLVEARNVIVKEGDLKTHSTVRLAVVDSWFDPPTLEL